MGVRALQLQRRDGTFRVRAGESEEKKQNLLLSKGTMVTNREGFQKGSDREKERVGWGGTVDPTGAGKNSGKGP